MCGDYEVVVMLICVVPPVECYLGVELAVGEGFGLLEGRLEKGFYFFGHLVERFFVFLLLCRQGFVMLFFTVTVIVLRV